MKIGFITFLFFLLNTVNVFATSHSDTLARHALVVGNGDYTYLPDLENPVNDATDMAKTLSVLGFNVDLKLDVSLDTLEDAIEQFGHRLTAGGVGLFYYAGHGIQVASKNYIIPVDAELKRPKDARRKAVSVNQVLDEIGGARNGLNIVVLDACRDNPLPREFRSASRGLARVDATADAPKGTLIAFATSPGSVAADGVGRNGTYTKHLLQQLKTPGLSVEQVFKKVLQGVDQETDGSQVPWVSSSFSGDFYFVPPGENAATLQSQDPIKINYSQPESSLVLWSLVAVLLLLTTLLAFKFFEPQSIPIKSSLTRDKKLAIKSTTEAKIPTPKLGECVNAQAIGYLVNLKTNQALAAILPGKQIILGRSKSRSDVYLEATAISAQHTALHWHAGSQSFLLEDLHSLNSTWIKGQTPVQGGVKTAIKPGEIFYLAHTENAFYIYVQDNTFRI